MRTRDLAWRLDVVRSLFEWRALGVRRGRCPLCCGRLFVRFSRDLLGTRCLRCEAAPMAMAMGTALARLAPGFASLRICELSSRGPFCAFLQRHATELTLSEYFDEVAPGEWVGDVQCQDLQALTYPDSSFDICTSTEVFEHVPDDRKGFAELHRVLAPGGLSLFTVPLGDADETVERAKLVDGSIVHSLTPAYHDDAQRGRGRVLVYRDYGRDVVERLLDAGFDEAEIAEPADPSGFGNRARVVVARKRSLAA